MVSAWSGAVVDASTRALRPLANAERAAGAFAYMKGVAPFLGVSAPDRRRALRGAWADLEAPTSRELGDTCVLLMQLPEREFHYTAYDLVDRFVRCADDRFLRQYAAELLTTVPWWDTVDGFVSAMVSPLMREYDDAALIDSWSASGDRWLIRAAIGHQRGWKRETGVARVLGLCDAHWGDREFFVAKAIGWAMRDIARLDPEAICAFLAAYDASNAVAIREARRGLLR